MPGRRAQSDRGANAATARAIKTRLATFVQDIRGVSWYQFAQEAGLLHTTVSGWRNPRNRVLPGVPKLIVLAERFGLSLNWLLLGEGAELRGVERPQPALAKDLRDYVLAQLADPEDPGASREVAEHLVPSGDELLRDLVEARRRQVRREFGEKWWAGIPPTLARLVLTAKNDAERKRLGEQLARTVLHMNDQFKPETEGEDS